MNRNEMWVSLIEKAYLKVMGGYDFPGSNSNIDLHALTGWIPERVSIKLDSPDLNINSLFDRIFAGLQRGDCLITAATGNLGDVVAERAGLVPTHAYAVLDIRKIQNLKLLQVKNPWTHLRWKGNFSELDTENWTPELQKALNFDRKSAIQVDNGVFWIDWKSLLNFFDVLYINWNPKLFLNRYVLHSTWTSGKGPVRDAYNLGENPQYKLEVNVTSDKSPVVWILLSRHILDRDDFANNKEFITVHVYETSGQRVYYPDNCYIEGVKINSPHYLVKVNPDKSTNTFTLVISQYEKHNTIHYTLKVFSSAEFKLSPVPNPYVCHKEVTGEWKGITAGGCPNYPETHKNNPAYFCELEESASSKTLSVLVKVRGPRQYAVGFIMISLSSSGGHPVFKKSVDTYRSTKNRSETASGWEKWLRNIERQFRYFGITDPEMKKDGLIIYSGQIIADLEDTLLDATGEEAGEDAYAQLIIKPNKHFLPKKNKDFARFQFGNLKQKHGESLVRYYTRIRGIAKKCSFSNESEAIRDHLIKTMTNNVVYASKQYARIRRSTKF
ncbi:calpain-7 isoform X1 [Paramuricea clavata]|uniref:Calpain-7 isoform X1 n=1 Tax=Paramuricea clavata TaxID=317549 RepID=A0A6S7HP73_PARCT|nr:calpain-7 isoform X1 [Paramuricea clavata]